MKCNDEPPLNTHTHRLSIYPEIIMHFIHQMYRDHTIE